MNRQVGMLFLMTLALLSACGPGGLPLPTPGVPADLSLAQQAAIAELSGSLDLPADQIRPVSTQAVNWADGCLGVQRPGVLCTEGMVPGFRIILEANGRQFDFHTNQDGSTLIRAEGIPAAGAVEEAAVRQLASNLGLLEGDIHLTSSVEVQWPDACLGVAIEGLACAQVETPGRLILLENGGRQFEYHTDQDGGHIQPASLALTWKQQGGIAGFCQSLTVYLSGEAYSLNCRGQFDGRTGVLTAQERTQLFAWIDQFGGTVLDASDPKGVADGMTRLLDLYGSAGRHPNDQEVQELFSWAQSIYLRLNQ